MMGETEPEIIADLSRHKDEQFCCDGSSPDDIFITGISGRFPWTDTVDEMKEKLYSKQNFIQVTENRWKTGTSRNVVSEFGNLNNLDRLDAEFFNIPHVGCNNIEAMQRIILEVSYEAVADSGYNPYDIRGKTVGVYCAITQTDLREALLRNYDITGMEFSGFLNALAANRVSYCLDLKGPSYVINSVWSSSSSALDQAYKDLKDGRIDAAIMAGAQTCVNPEMTLNCLKFGACAVGKPCCPFDAKACGLIRTETVAALFLQKAESARRCYAKVMNSLSYTSGYLPKGIHSHSEEYLKDFYCEVLDGCGLKTADIGYIEASGFGTVNEDAIEVNSITEVYCKGREKPLWIGTVKSNLGNTEASSTICGLIKSIFALENDLIPPNLNYNEPNPECPALLDGSVKVVTESTELTTPYVAVNNLGMAGLMSQVILKRNTVQREERKKRSIPELLLYSATTEEAVKYVIDTVTNKKLSSDFILLLNNLAFTPVSSKPYRGYALLGENPVREIEICLQEKREIWYVITGMGCQWPGMGASLMEIDIFANSIRQSAKVLEPFGMDLLELMKPHTNHLLQHRKITPAFVAICAIQIALVDILKELGVEPDGIVGHSTGELVCAYADGCCTAEQTILSAYLRGKAVEASNLPDGAMAAVGMSWEEAKTICPDNVYPACHNAEDSITISGLAEPVKAFVSKLEKDGRFARVVDAYGYAFHCREISTAAPLLKSELENVILEPKQRSKRWLSTSYPPDQWNKPAASIADSSYFVHNLMSTVHFAEALTHIPTNAITIEIGPHFLLQSILKRVIGNNASYLGMMKRHENNNNFMLTTIGKMYRLGLNPKINCLCPPPKYPLPRGLPSISSILKWDHSTSWRCPIYVKCDYDYMHGTDFEDCERYLLDYNVGGRTLYPAMGYVVLTWMILAEKMDKEITEMPITVEDFKVYKATTISPLEKKTIRVRISSSREKFEIFDKEDLVASGRLASLSELIFNPPAPQYKILPDNETLPAEEIYRELKIRGYDYGPNFQALREINMEGSQGLIQWSENWVSYLQAHLLLFEFSYDHSLILPSGAVSIKIDPKKVRNGFNESLNQGLKGLPVTFEKYTQRCCSSGIEIRQVTFKPTIISPLTCKSPVLEECHFVPYNQICAIPDRVRQKYVEYINVCSKVASKAAVSVDQVLAKKLETCITADVKQEIIESYLQAQNKDYIVLQILNELCDSVSQAEEENMVLAKYLKNIIGSDFLYKTLFEEYPLRSILEIIAENTSNKLTIVEVFNGCFSALGPVSSMMKKYYIRKLNCTLVCDETHYVDADTLKEAGIHVQIREEHHVRKQDVVISSFLFGDAKAFQANLEFLRSLSRKGSYILFYHKTFVSPAEAFLSYLYREALQTLSESEVQAIFKKEHLTVIAKKSDSLGSTLYLLRYQNTNISSTSDIIVNIQDGNHEWINQLKLSMLSASGRVWLIADDSSVNGIIGLVKCLKHEPGGDKIRCVYVFKDEKLRSVPAFDLKNPFYAEVAERDVLMNVYRNGVWGGYNHFELSCGCDHKVIEQSFLKCTKTGDLTSLGWIESPISYELESDKLRNVVHIYYSALNPRDAMLASGKFFPNVTEDISNSGETNALGIEFSGMSEDGRRLMGLAPCRAISTSIQADRSITFDVPENWTLEEAATVPFAYCTCYHALLVHGQLKRNETVLISSESEEIKTAAIRIALSLNCKTFITVHSNERNGHLKEKFPQITEIEVDVCERSSIDDFVLNATDGKGVDLVLNLNNDHENLLACTRCLAENGHFVNIAKHDLVGQDHSIGMGLFLGHAHFMTVSFESLLRTDSIHDETLRKVAELFNEGVKSGLVQPLERTVYQRDDAENAFRFLTTQKPVNKVLLKIRDEEPKKSDILGPPKAKAAAYFYKHKVYIVVGGLGGFGIELVKWLLKNGAKNIIITSRHGAKTAHQNLCLLRWKTIGANVQVHALDSSEKGKAIQLLKAASAIGPVGGIFNCAVVLRDAFIENQTEKDFAEVTAAKNSTFKNLDELSRLMCPKLDYFVCFSSVSSSKGIAGKCNDGYANSSMERICENRRRDGKHGLAIQFGIIGDTGHVYRLTGEDSVIADISPQKVYSCLDTLEYFLNLNKPIVSSYVIADENGETLQQRDLLHQLAKLLGVSSITEFNMTTSLKDMGVDTLGGSELQNLLEFHYDVIVPIKRLLDMSINKILIMAERKTLKYDKSSEKDSFVPVRFSLPKEILPSSPVLSLNTGQSGTPVFIVHPLPMELLKIESLAQKISAPVYGLSTSKGMSVENLASLAVDYIKEIKKYSSTFDLIGLGTGSCVAFEIALQSQNNRRDFPSVKNIMFLDGSSYLADAFFHDQDSKYSSKTEAEHLYDFIMQFSSQEMPIIKHKLEKSKDTESRIFYMLKQINASASEKTYNSEVSEGVTLYQKILALSEGYRPRTKLISNLTLIEFPGKLLPNEVASVKVALGKFCSGKIDICRIPGGKKYLNQRDISTAQAELINSILETERK